MRLPNRLLRSASCALVVAIAACSSEGEVGEGADNLTSLTARQRVLTFESIVYVDKVFNDDQIRGIVEEQSRTAFGPLLHSGITANTREMKAANNIRKRPIMVMDSPTAQPREMLEVRYTYTDNAVVPVKMAEKTSLSLAVLGAGAETKTKQIVELCTPNDKESRDDAAGGLLWYDFDVNRASCRHAMENEQKQIDADREKLPDPENTVPGSLVQRVFQPVTMQFSQAATANRPTFPEYDRLFSGPSEPGVLTIVLISGRLEHTRVAARKDAGFSEYLATLEVLFDNNPDFAVTKIEPETNISTISAEGRKFDNLTFRDFINWQLHNRGFPEGMPTSSRDNIKVTVGRKLDSHWVTFEKKVKVQIGAQPPKDLTIRLETLFGADEDPTPHKRAMQRGDVFVYNGHSYIGGGPLDPDNFRAPDSFTRGYQILWFDSCISWNYYEKDFFTQKAGGSQNLELITNGIEAPEDDSGAAEGRLLSKLIDGSMPSYQALLQAAKATDSLRVVDGEIDNKWDAKKTPIRFVK